MGYPRAYGRERISKLVHACLRAFSSLFQPGTATADNGRPTFISRLAKSAIAAITVLASFGVHAVPGTILVVGDSLSAEYGLPRDSGWVKLLDDRLRQNGLDYTVVNASISGETTSGGLSRLPALLNQHAPKIVIIELGGNDGLRGLDPRATESNLDSMITRSQKAGARVLLVGMRLPPNYGRDFNARFEAIFPKLASRHRTGLVKFFFEGFAEKIDLFQPDRIHPTIQAQPLMLDNIWPALKPLLSGTPNQAQAPIRGMERSVQTEASRAAVPR